MAVIKQQELDKPKRGRKPVYPPNAPKCPSCGKKSMPGEPLAHYESCYYVTGKARGSGTPRAKRSGAFEVSPPAERQELKSEIDTLAGELELSRGEVVARSFDLFAKKHAKKRG